jgi:hypothetical protein
MQKVLMPQGFSAAAENPWYATTFGMSKTLMLQGFSASHAKKPVISGIFS